MSSPSLVEAARQMVRLLFKKAGLAEFARSVSPIIAVAVGAVGGGYVSTVSLPASLYLAIVLLVVCSISVSIRDR